MGFLDKFRKKPAVSPGGSSIYRYETPEDQGWRPPQAYGVYAKAAPSAPFACPRISLPGICFSQSVS